MYVRIYVMYELLYIYIFMPCAHTCVHLHVAVTASMVVMFSRAGCQSIIHSSYNSPLVRTYTWPAIIDP